MVLNIKCNFTVNINVSIIIAVSGISLIYTIFVFGSVEMVLKLIFYYYGKKCFGFFTTDVIDVYENAKNIYFTILIY